MAAPNLISPTTITGKTTYLTLANTNETDLLVNSSNSNKVFKVMNVMLVNIDGTAAVDGSVTIYTAASGGTGYKIANTVTIPADSSIVVISRDNPLWLEEDRRLTVQASAANDLAIICSYEEIT